jgi:hypothetical protein
VQGALRVLLAEPSLIKAAQRLSLLSLITNQGPSDRLDLANRIIV